MLRSGAGRFRILATMLACLSALSTPPAAAQQGVTDCIKTVDDLMTALFRRAGVGWDNTRLAYRVSKGPGATPSELPGAWAQKLENCPSEAVVERLAKTPTMESVVTNLFGPAGFKWEARLEATGSIRVSIARIVPRPDSLAGDDACHTGANAFLTEVFKRLNMYWDDAKGWQPAIDVRVAGDSVRNAWGKWRGQCPNPPTYLVPLRDWKGRPTREDLAFLADLAFTNPKNRWSVDNLGDKGAPQVVLTRPPASATAPTTPVVPATPPAQPPTDRQADDIARHKRLLARLENIELAVQDVKAQVGQGGVLAFLWGILSWLGVLLAVLLGSALTYWFAARFHVLSLLKPISDDARTAREATGTARAMNDSLARQLKEITGRLSQNHGDIAARFQQLEYGVASLRRGQDLGFDGDRPRDIGSGDGPRNTVPTSYSPDEAELRRLWNVAIVTPPERDAMVTRFNGTLARLRAESTGQMNLVETSAGSDRRDSNVLLVAIRGHPELCYVLPSPYLQISDLAQHGFRFAREEFGGAYALQASGSVTDCSLERIAIFRQNDAGEWSRLFQKGDLRLPRLS